jgi:hypothetical protein
VKQIAAAQTVAISLKANAVKIAGRRRLEGRRRMKGRNEGNVWSIISTLIQQEKVIARLMSCAGIVQKVGDAIIEGDALSTQLERPVLRVDVIIPEITNVCLNVKATVLEKKVTIQTIQHKREHILKSYSRCSRIYSSGNDWSGASSFSSHYEESSVCNNIFFVCFFCCCGSSCSEKDKNK